MYKKITLLLTLLFSLSGFGQERSCTHFKNGTFRITDPATKKVCIITRDGDTQTEKMEESEEVYDFDITWIDDCTYTVTPTPASTARNKKLLKGGTMTVKITQVNEYSYIQRVTVANNPKFRRVDEVFVINAEDKEKDMKY